MVKPMTKMQFKTLVKESFEFVFWSIIGAGLLFGALWFMAFTLHGFLTMVSLI